MVEKVRHKDRPPTWLNQRTGFEYDNRDEALIAEQEAAQRQHEEASRGK